MSWALIAACLWVVVACVNAAIPSKRRHWPAAYVLIAVGVPIVIWVFAIDGVWMGLLCLAAGLSILRWPVIYLVRWVTRGSGQSG